MTKAVTSAAPQGHCSRCGKIWTLEAEQGVCQWCGKPATCHDTRTPPRSIKSSRKRRQAPSNGNGYDQLKGDYATYNKVASPFAHKAMADDRQDLLHDIIYHLASVHRSKRNNGNQPFTEAMMYRTASHVKDHYWYSHYKHTMGLDCGHCSKAQRRKCKEDWLYGDCPKAIKLESLNKPMLDDDGNLTELGDLIADDTAIDLDAWLDAKQFLIGAPQRLKGIAFKLRDGIPLDAKDKMYLQRFRREQIKLF